MIQVDRGKRGQPEKRFKTFKIFWTYLLEMELTGKRISLFLTKVKPWIFCNKV